MSLSIANTTYVFTDDFSRPLAAINTLTRARKYDRMSMVKSAFHYFNNKEETVKKLAILFLSVLLLLSFLSGCAAKKWVYTDRDGDVSVIMSPDGVKYRAWNRDYYIVGLKSGKKIGTLLPEFEEDEKPLYAIDGVDGDKYIVTKKETGGQGIDPQYEFTIFVRMGESFGYDYRDPNVSGVVFIPKAEFSDDLDYLTYLKEHGVSGDEAKVIMGDILLGRTDEEVFSNELMDESFLIRHDEKCAFVGELVYSPENADWFAYKATVYYNPESGYYIGISRFSTVDMYLLTDDSVIALGISIVDD